jgi:hypothetical protein
MNRNWRTWAFTGLVSVIGGLLPAAFSPASAQDIVPQENRGVPQDWSHRNAIVRNAETMKEASGKGVVAFERWKQKLKDPRYTMAVAKKTIDVQPTANKIFSGQQLAFFNRFDRQPKKSSALRDWSNVLGGGTDGLGGSGVPGVFPAKYNFNINAAPSCANDFVVYPTNGAGATSSGNAETRLGTFTARPNNNRTITIGEPGTPRSVILTAVDDTPTPAANQFTRGPDTTNSVEAQTNATNLAAAVNRFTHQTGISATSNAGVVTFSRNSGGNSADIPITDNLNNFSLANNDVDGTGGPGQPTIIAFNQLYQGTGVGACNGSWNQNGATKAPNVMWAYNTGDGYVVETSPVLSYDDNGKQVAFIQRSGNTLQLVLLKWVAGQGSAGVPVTPSVVAANGAAYAAQRATAGSAMYVMTLNGTSNTGSAPTYSSPFVDYVDDVLWVGDGNGRLHKFTGVFKGTPAEVVGGGFPATLEAGLKLSPPVSNNGQVYIGSSAGAGTVGGKLYRVRASDGVVLATSAKLARNDTPGVRESPIIDGRTGQVYTFIYNDRTTVYSVPAQCTAFTGEIDGCRAVFQFAESFAGGSSGARQFIGRGNSTSRVLYAGGFDDAFYSSNNSTGAMYIVGGRATNSFYATLWKIPIVNGVMQAAIPGHEFGARDRYQEGDVDEGTDNLQQIAPVTVQKNGNNEYVFVSTATYAKAQLGCGAGTFANSACIFMYNLADLNGSGVGTGAAWGTTNVPSAALAAPGGTGGIVVDNISATTGASQIYFTQLQSGGNAIQASQSGLQ